MTGWVAIIALFILGGIVGIGVVVVLAIHFEDGRGSLTDRAPGLFSSGTRRMLGVRVDHTACHYVTNPRHACPTCRRAHYMDERR
jgi:hypothetical protein